MLLQVLSLEVAHTVAILRDNFLNGHVVIEDIVH